MPTEAMENTVANLKESLLAVAGEEPILKIVIGDKERWRFLNTDENPWPEYISKLLSWEEAKEIVDYDFDSGFGGTESHPIMAWTQTRVIFSVCYDGSEWLASAPRNPTDGITPQHYGGG
jgi:hypothetical protein